MLENITIGQTTSLTDRVKELGKINAIIIDPNCKTYSLQGIDTSTFIYLKENFQVKYSPNLSHL
jgi:hypothetical protein